MTTSRAIVRDGLSIISAGIDSVQADRLFETSGALNALRDDVEAANHVYLVGAGKASLAMASVIELELGGHIDDGVIVVPAGYIETLPDRYEPPARITCLQAGHPVPDNRGVQAAGHALEYAVQCQSGDLLIVLISGGASALWAGYAPGISLEDAAETTKILLESGVPIQNMNVVRKHISSISGGRLLEVAAPATIRALVISDVVGDDLSAIGSGPCSPDSSTYSDALLIIREKGLEDRLPASVMKHLKDGANGLVPEPPKPGSTHEFDADIQLIGTNKTAIDAMVEAATEQGLKVVDVLTEVTGEARDFGADVGRAASRLKPGTCLIWGGETTVTLTGDGTGGRNHEVALAAAIELEGTSRDVIVFSAGTDGRDGSTQSAGAWSDAQTLDRGRSMGIDGRIALARNDSGTFFATLGQSIVTGPTHTNVTDVGIAVRGTVVGP